MTKPMKQYLMDAAQEIVDKAKSEKRPLTHAEEDEANEYLDRVRKIQDNERLRERTPEQVKQDKEELRRKVNEITAGFNLPLEGGRGGHSPLLVSDVHLRSHAEAVREGRTFGAVEELYGFKAKVTVATDMGSPGSWGAGAILDPITLRRFAGIPVEELTGATAQMPSLTLPAGAAGVAESTAHGEFDAIDVANLTTLRYGRWSDVTSFVDEFTNLRSINQAHGVGIARDLNLVDLTAIQTVAGSVTALTPPTSTATFAKPSSKWRPRCWATRPTSSSSAPRRRWEWSPGTHRPAVMTAHR